MESISPVSLKRSTGICSGVFCFADATGLSDAASFTLSATSLAKSSESYASTSSLPSTVALGVGELSFDELMSGILSEALNALSVASWMVESDLEIVEEAEELSSS
jgi:hypothetical protein